MVKRVQWICQNFSYYHGPHLQTSLGAHFANSWLIELVIFQWFVLNPTLPLPMFPNGSPGLAGWHHRKRVAEHDGDGGGGGECVRTA